MMLYMSNFITSHAPLIKRMLNSSGLEAFWPLQESTASSIFNLLNGSVRFEECSSDTFLKSRLLKIGLDEKSSLKIFFEKGNDLLMDTCRVINKSTVNR